MLRRRPLGLLHPLTYLHPSPCAFLALPRPLPCYTPYLANPLPCYTPYLATHTPHLATHPHQVEESPRDARTTIYYKNVMAREMANNTMAKVHLRDATLRDADHAHAHRA